MLPSHFVTVTLINKQRSISFSAPSLKKTVVSVLDYLGVCGHDVNVHLVNEKTISSLHLQFFDDPSPTDCITFPFHVPEGAHGLLGEIFVCPEVAISYAKKHKKDPYHETTLYLVHALLHLVGYDDIDPKERAMMRKQERKILALLEKKSLLLQSPKKN